MGTTKRSEAVERARLMLNQKSRAKESPFKILVDAAFLEDKAALHFLGDCFFCGDFGAKDIHLAKYIYEIADGKTPKAILQYKEVSDTFPQTQNPTDLNSRDSEERHLAATVRRIDDRIFYLQDRLERGSSAYFLEGDIQADFAQKRQEVYQLTQLRSCPYYGRLDVFNGNSTKTYYISEENFGLQNDIVSVWSPFGRHYRQKFELEFSESGIHYIVKRRRQLDIEDGKLLGFLDTYVEGESIGDSNDSAKAAFDPFLQKVLEQKRGEANISNIIRSIQTKQNEIIDFDFDKSFIVQGCAGSGKTMILLHRLANLKYNRPNTRWNTVKIITPNEQFNTYIDNLSENLGINMIPKRSIAGYYLEIIQRYADDTLKASADAFFRIKKNIVSDEKCQKEVVRFVYSDKFVKCIRNALEKKRDQLIDEEKPEKGTQLDKIIRANFADRREGIKRLVTNVIRDNKYFLNWKKEGPSFYKGQLIPEEQIPEHKEERFCQCLLYAEVLVHFFLKGAPKQQDNLLCIDEGQDISQFQYLLLHRVNRNSVCFNIYGDIAQKMQQTCGVDQWSSLQKFIKEIPGTSKGKDVCLFHLNENYRNSEEIVSFCNTTLKKNDRALGIKIGRNVQRIQANEVETLCKFHWLLKNRVVIISNQFSSVPNSIKSICIHGEVQQNKISLMTVSEVKGLEFDVALVYDQGMLEAEKYIAYTRCLSELYIIDSSEAAFI